MTLDSIVRLMALTSNDELRKLLVDEFRMKFNDKMDSSKLYMLAINSFHKAEKIRTFMSKHQLSFSEAECYMNSNDLRAFYLSASKLVNQKGLICADVFFKIGSFLLKSSYSTKLEFDCSNRLFNIAHQRILERQSGFFTRLIPWKTKEEKRTDTRMSLTKATETS